MSPYVVGGLIGAAVTLVVWVLTAVREHLASKRQKREYDRAVLKGVLADYLAALDSLTLAVMEEPPSVTPNAVDHVLERVVDRVGLEPLFFWAGRMLRRLVYGRRPDELVDRMAIASAHLRLVAPPEILALMRELDDLFGEQRPRDDSWQSSWEVARERLRSGFRDALYD